MFWSLGTDRQGLPEKIFNLSFNVIFNVDLIDYLPVFLCYCIQTIQKHQEAVSFYKSLCIPHVLMFSCIKCVPANFAKFKGNTCAKPSF